MADSSLQEISFMPSTIETIDFALYDWINEKMDIYATSESGWKKVPITWVSAERAHQMKSSKDIRDSSGLIKLPLITIERKSINKDPTKTGSVPANIRPVNDEKGGTLVFARRINQEKTSNFATADQVKRTTLNQTETRNIYRRDNRVFPLYENRSSRRLTNKVVYQTISIPIPVHVTVSYQINIKTDYLQQLNEITTPFYTKNGNTRYIQLFREQHRYDAFIKGDFTYENNSPSLNEERKNYGASVNIEVLGYLIGEDKNQEQPKLVIRENAVEVKIPRERVIMGDIPDFLSSAKNKTSYRE